MSDDVNLPSYARLPNGPCEPNVTLKGIMVVDQPHKMAKTLMKMAHHLGKPKAQAKQSHRPHSRQQKKGNVKWY